YDTTKKLSGKYSKPERPVKDKEGRPITEIQQQRNRWVEYFKELLNKPAPMNPPDIEAAHTDLSIDVTTTATKEIRMAIRQIKSGKAAGPDSIPAEALNSDIEVTTNMLHLPFKKIWGEGRISDRSLSADDVVQKNDESSTTKPSSSENKTPSK
ncbi:unnamed protein product, partial [Schistosoma curassoni]|uniref:(d)CMP kinase n=1 Tax=Schistosoma curassoni TaxID=6186 RepID=A0A183JNX0_9TREM